MAISVEKCLAKIEEELMLAKNSRGQESLREKVYSIKILCELILDEQVADIPVKPVVAVNQTAMQQPVFQQSAFQQPVIQQPMNVNQAKKIDIDEANGDSLFDF